MGIPGGGSRADKSREARESIMISGLAVCVGKGGVHVYLPGRGKKQGMNLES